MKFKNKIVPFFSWDGRLGKMLDFWGRHQKWWWTGITVFILVWFSYDVGRLVSRADLYSGSQNVKGVITVDEAIEKSKEFEGGRLIITSENNARFIDTSGSSWEIPSFAKNVSKNDLDTLKENGVMMDGNFIIRVAPVKAKPKDLLVATITDLLFKIVIVGFYAFIIYIIMKHLGGASKGRFKKITVKTAPDIKIVDVAGYDGVKGELLDVVDYLRDPEKFTKVGARPPRGVLLHGPPGTGKTLMAKAVAGEAAASFFEQSASSFVQVYAGEGAKSVRKLFEEARKAAPSVIFIDEIDAVGAARSGGSHDERVQTLNAILTEMDGFNDNLGLVVVAATNRIDTLDEALVRPGRFDRKVWISLPSITDREKILKIHARKVKFDSNIDWKYWAAKTQGFSGADLAALVNEAAIEAARSNKDLVDDISLTKARDRVWIGAKNHGQILSDDERKTVSIHELGHAFIRLQTKGRVEKVSISPRGQSLGVTVAIKDEKFLHSKQDIEDELLTLMGGRAAEKVILGHVTGGAIDDMMRASSLAREAALRFGSSSWGAYVPSDNSQQSIEDEASSMVNSAYEKACSLIEMGKDKIIKASEVLLEKEELDELELSSLL